MNEELWNDEELWNIEEHANAWSSLRGKCDPKIQVALDQRLDRLRRLGNLAKRPLSAPLGGGIFELRYKKARALYYFREDRTIVFLHGLIKGGRKVPQKDIGLARERMATIEG